jgi:hypothetical protein
MATETPDPSGAPSAARRELGGLNYRAPVVRRARRVTPTPSGARDSPGRRVRLRARDGLDRLAQRAGVAAVYHTPVGVKQTNQLFKGAMIEAYATGEEQALDPGRLRLGFDALRDEHTLLETTIDASPHLALARSMLEPDGRLAECYVARARRGTLDWRPPLRLSDGFVAYMRRGFAAALEQVDRGEQAVVLVAWVEDEPYIVDGRHRAAVACLRSREVVCRDVSRVYGDSYFRWISAVIARRPGVHRKHLRFWARVERQIDGASSATR